MTLCPVKHLLTAVLLLLLTVSGAVSETDDEPMFTQLVYTAAFSEHFPFQNISVDQEIAVNPPVAVQEGFDGGVTYGIIEGNEADLFYLEPVNGTLYLRRQVDREKLDTDVFSLVIEASAAADSTRFSLARLMVQVLDVNDNAPRFDPPYHNVSIVENLPNGFNVLKSIAIDPDQGPNGQFTYRLDDESGAFKIDPITGWLSVADHRQLDREKRSSLTVFITAVEYTPSLETQLWNGSSKARIDINLIDSNDNNPVFQPVDVYSFTVESDAEAGTIVGQVSAVDEDAAGNGKVHYELRSLNSSSADEIKIPFSIDPHLGRISITHPQSLTSKSYSLLVEASDSPSDPEQRRTATAIVKIRVLGSNNEIPHFLSSAYEFWIGASAAVDTSVGQVKADGFRDYQGVRYAIDQQNRPAPLSIDQADGVIRVVRRLDEEPIERFDLNVSASDGQQTAATNLTIHVVNVNNNRGARQDVAPYRFSVAENLNGVLVGRIAYPTGEARNQRTHSEQLEFAALENEITASRLIVFPNGSIYTKEALDHESMPTMSLLIAVHETGTRRPVDTLQVVVHVVDVNDNRPEFDRHVYTGHISENSPAGTLVELTEPIIVTDRDSFPNNVTLMSLTGPDSGRFSVDPMTGKVRAADNSLDREFQSVYNLTLVSTDAGNLSSTAQLIIWVDDVDDNGPEVGGFVPAAGVVVLERSRDRNELGDQTLVLCSDGLCSPPPPLDRETVALPSGKSLHTYRRVVNWMRSILALDGPMSQEQVEQSFQRLFPQSTILIQVAKSAAFDGNLGFFSLTDRDREGEFPAAASTSSVKFSLVQGEDVAEFIQLDPTSGALLAKNLSLAEDEYSFTIQVVDELGRSSQRNVTIQLVNYNLYAPVFDQAVYHLNLPEGFYQTRAFITLTARDEDGGDNGRVTYTLVNNGTQELPFQIDPVTGQLTVDGLVDREKVESYQFTIEAADHGVPELKSSAIVSIRVDDVNDNVPQFRTNWTTRPVDSVPRQRSSDLTLPLFKASARHGTPAGTLLTQVSATDGDTDLKHNANITYRLENSSDLFRIDPLIGTLYTLNDIDFDRQKEYDVVVVAMDDGRPRLSSSAVVQIQVDDAPCVRREPLFDQNQFDVSLEENVPIPHVLINLSAWHLVEDFRLILNQTDLVPMFAVDQTEPVVWLIQSIDREQIPSYRLTMTVEREKDWRKRYCSQGAENLSVNLNIVDVNDNAPVFDFTDSPLIKAISSDAPTGREVVTVKATDADHGINAMILYTLTPDVRRNGRAFDTKYLDVHPSTGKISVAAPLNQVAGRSLHYVLQATDLGGSPAGKSTSLPMIVHVVDRSHQVTLVLGKRTEHLQAHYHNISHFIGNVSSLDVRIQNMEAHRNGDAIDKTTTDVFLYAVNNSSRLVESEVLMRALNQKREELEEMLADYHLLDIKSKPQKLHSTMKMETAHVTLVAMGAAIFVGTVIAVVCIVLSRKRYMRPALAVPAMPVALDYRLERISNSGMAVPAAAVGGPPPPAELWTANCPHNLFSPRTPQWAIPRTVIRPNLKNPNSVLGASVQRRPLCHGCGKLMSEESDDRQPPMPSSKSGRAAPSPHRCHYSNRKYPQRLSPRFLDEQDEEPKNPLATTPPVAPKASMRDLYADGAGSGTSDSASSSDRSCKSSLEAFHDSLDISLHRR